MLSVQVLSGGLIHQTRKIHLRTNGVLQEVVLQRVNTSIFTQPYAVMENLRLVNQFLPASYPFSSPVALETLAGSGLYKDPQGDYWRVFLYIKNSISYSVPPNAGYVDEAGRAYGIFLTALRDLDPQKLFIPIASFHNLDRRFDLLQQAEKRASDRKLIAKESIDQIGQYYNELPLNFANLPIRAVHNDCKLSNLLFCKTTQQCLAVIDLDTLMPGYVVTDFGDMVRGMCSTVTEEERNLDLVAFNPANYTALRKGFIAATEEWLSAEEQDRLADGAVYIVLEQAVRFLTDYLDNDSYYGASYPQHNYDRACNQLTLLASMLEQI